ncbi:6140_t:CDS:2, partial [Racocetra persica]
MGFFVVYVVRETKTIIPDKVVKVLHTESSQFYDILDATTNDQFEDCVVQVFLRKPPENWVYVEEGLEDQYYNLFYDTGKHTKSNLKRDKLEQLASSLELSVVQPWATNDNWKIIINEVFILISSIQKYAKNLEQINQVMKEIYLSDTLAHQPANDLK